MLVSVDCVVSVTEATRVMRLLQSESTPAPKKRLLMKSTFGDYRKKMADELRQLDASLLFVACLILITFVISSVSVYHIISEPRLHYLGSRHTACSRQCWSLFCRPTLPADIVSGYIWRLTCWLVCHGAITVMLVVGHQSDNWHCSPTMTGHVVRLLECHHEQGWSLDITSQVVSPSQFLSLCGSNLCVLMGRVKTFCILLTSLRQVFFGLPVC